jgi:CheY-like chemotaxis protein
VSSIVVCEDDAMIRKLVQAALRATPHELHFAENGRDGLALVARVRPDVVFSDVAMPEMNGFEMADAIRGTAELAHIPIVFMTAAVQRQQIDECFEHGAAAHLAKPFTVADLRARVDQFVKS